MGLPAGRKGDAPPPPSTTLLGDWYANILILRPAHIVLFISEHSRLVVPVPAREIGSVIVRLRSALQDLLRELGIPEEVIERELAAMEDVCIAPTTGGACARSALGSLNDAAYMLTVDMQYHPEKTLLERAVDLSETPSGPLHMRSPRSVTREYLTGYQ